MNSASPTRPKPFTSRIPVYVKKGHPSKLSCQENEICEKHSMQTSSKILVKNSSPAQRKLVNNTYKLQKLKTFIKNCEQSKISNKPPVLSQISSKISVKKSHNEQRKLEEKYSSQTKKHLRTDMKNKSCEKPCPKESVTQSSNKTSIKNSHQTVKVNILTDKNSKSSDYKHASLQNLLPIAVNNVNSEEPKINKLSFDIAIEKENQGTVKTDFDAQEDIKFEANEVYRKMILSNRELSPSICRLTSGLKLSSVHRPSVYQKFELHPDPFRQAMEAIANYSAKRASRKHSLVVQERKIQSPYKERTSLYVPGATPAEVVMMRLEAIKAKKMQKDASKSLKKKVTFNFQVEEYTTKDDYNSEQKESKSSECRLMQINEGSTENTPFTPPRESKKTEISEINEDNISLSLQSNTESDVIKLKCNKKPQLVFEDSHNAKMASSHTHTNSEKQFHSSVNENGNLCTPFPNSTTSDACETVKKILPVECEESLLYSSKEPELFSASHFVSGDTKLISEPFNSPKSIHQTALKKYINGQNIQRTSKAKIYTPRPIFLSSNKRQSCENQSPEFFDDAPRLINCPNAAPIYTPLVLKSMAKSYVTSPNNDLSPVRLKLDFASMEKDTPMKETPIKKLVGTVPFDKILTAKKKLDDLADQECSFFMLNAGIPVICGRYLLNPISVTLTEGDEMHFVPIRL